MEPSAIGREGAAGRVNDVVERVTEAARQFLAGRRVVLAGLPVAAATRFVGLLRRLRSDRCVAVGLTLGAGELPGITPPTPPARTETASGAVLRRARPSDADAFARAVAENLDHLGPWMPWATPAAADAAVQRERLVAADATWDDGSDYEFAVLTADERQLIGGCGLMRRIGPGGIEIGYWVHVDHTRRGHATAAALALTEAAWTLPGVERVEIHCDEANVASRAVPVRLGYRLDRIDDVGATAPGETGRSMVWIAERSGDAD